MQKNKLFFGSLLILLLISCNLPVMARKTIPTTEPSASPTLEPAATSTQESKIPPLETAAPNAMDSSESFQLAIITPAEFAGTLQVLADFKNKTGIPTRIITLEEIYTKCKGRDQAEQVKTCLAQLTSNNGIHFALLVGDMDKFPVRFTKADRDTPEAGYTAFFPTDLYYADLFKTEGSFDNWDANNNGYYGEICGEITTCPLNSDEVDLHPDIAVGRLPVSNLEEVELYIKKDMNYETSAWNSEWAGKTLLIGTTTWVPDSCSYQNAVAANLPSGFQTIKLYEEGSPCAGSALPSTQTIIDTMNSGVGFISYLGHGDNTMWAGYLTIKDAIDLGNSPSIIFSAACGTSEFGPRPPADPYLDVNGVLHSGNAAGEVFTEVPPPPANIQQEYIDGFGEAITVQSYGGAVIYVGAITGAQPYSLDLNADFFASLSAGKITAGDMWMYMIERYYEQNTFPVHVDPPDWTVLARFHQPWKFMLFGDPSLRVGGIPPSN